jgi:hypothetical protein
MTFKEVKCPTCGNTALLCVEIDEFNCYWCRMRYGDWLPYSILKEKEGMDNDSNPRMFCKS